MGDSPKRRPVVGSDDTLPASYPPDDDPVITPPPGERYRLGAELGRGGMGRVVEAFDTQLGRTVALKEVLPRGGPGIQRRFQREVQITARLEHASIVPLYDSGVTVDGRQFYVMRRVTGRPLDEMVSRARGLGERLALLPAMLAAIDAVAHAHRRGVIHRDLKPANILLGELGETVVIDWGLAKVIGEPDDDDDDDSPVAADSLQTQLGSVFGTPGFMPPEQARGEELGPRGDVYALGATLYQLLAGKPPHAGNSATEMLDSTRNHTLAPLHDEAPGVPPELVAIVEKALSFDASARYPNAAALGEDVRRFNTGQLVAAHHYTTPQRIRRFARRNRAPLGVAALALVAVAVLAWYGVHRIVTERDLATAAGEDALRQKQAAESTRDRLVERQDALTVMRASALLESNPTEAIAVLKQLPATSPKRSDAVAIARAAVTRGVASAIQGAEVLSVGLDLSPDGTRLAQSTRDGMVRVWDLDRRRLMLQKQYGGFPHAFWVKQGTALLVLLQRQPPELLEMTSASKPLPFPPLTFGVADDPGDRFAGMDAKGNALLLDLTALTATPLWPGHDCAQVEIARDGHWIMLNDNAHVVAVDPTGKELLHHDGPARFAVVSRSNKLAVLDGDTIYQAPIIAGAIWTQLPPTPTRPSLITFRGDHVVAFVSSGDLLEWSPAGYRQLGSVDPVFFPVVEAADDRLILASGEGKLHVFDGTSHTEVRVPGVLPQIRIVARRDHSRVVVVGGGMIVDYDLDNFMPRAITGREAAFVDDDTILLWDQGSDEWGWYDIATRHIQSFKYEPHGLPMLTAIDPAGSRVLFREMAGPRSRLIVIDKHDSRQNILAEGNEVDGRLIEDGAVLLTKGNGEISLIPRGASPRPLVKLDGEITGIVPLGNRRYAAVSSHGEAVRGNYESGDVERIHLDTAMTSFVATDRAGHPVIVLDNRLLLWDRDVVELAHFDKTIVQVAPVNGGLLVTLADRSSLILELGPGGGQHRILPAAHEVNPVSDEDGNTVVGLGLAAQTVIVDLPARSRWTLPARYDGSAMSISPSGHWVLQHRGNTQFMLWQLPMPSSDLDAWYDEQTNATEDSDDVLTWPWQAPLKP